MRAEAKPKHRQASGVELLILGTDSAYRADHKAHDAANAGSSTTDRGVQRESSRAHILQPATTPLNELVSILPQVSSLFQKAATALKPESIRLEAQLKSLRSEALAVRTELLAWYSAQPASLCPTTVQRFTQLFTMRFPDSKALSCNTLRADSYTDREYSPYTAVVYRPRS